MLTQHAQSMRILIVEDHKPLREALARTATGWGAEVIEAGSVSEGSAKLDLLPNVVLVDVALPDGNVRPVVQKAVRMRPMPALIAMSGQASPEEAFELAGIGVRRYLPKPISAEDLHEALEGVIHDLPDLEILARQLVMHLPMRDVLDRVRAAMVDEAVAITNGSRSAAARILGVSRQAIQQALRKQFPPNQRDGHGDRH